VSTDLSKSEARALLAVVKYVALTCANLGAELWGKRGRANCSCPWARPAGAVIKKLRARGFVDRHRVAGDPRTFYKATWRGERHLMTDATTRATAGLGPTATPDQQMKALTLTQISVRLDAHLRRIEEDPVPNPWNDGKVNGTKPFYNAGASVGGARVSICYVSYQGRTRLKKVDALKYLAWLDAGNVGKHWNILPR